MEKEILDVFNVSAKDDEDVRHQVYGGVEKSHGERLECWLSLLPPNISASVQLALRQERPFLPPDVTPEMMAASCENFPKMNHIEILYKCIALAMASENYEMAGALVYVADRATYRFGASQALLKVVNTILEKNRATPLAPQVIIRKARVMKDDGDLHGAMRVLDAVITKESSWDYKTEDQYSNVKAVCVQVKGQILHNLGLWKEAIEPLVESVVDFQKVKDDKGTSSSLGLLTKCLKKLTLAEYEEMKEKYPSMFVQSHPCYEAYVQGMDAVKYIADLGGTLYAAKHQLLAEESLLMFALQKPPSARGFQWFQTIVDDIKQTLTTHEAVNNLKSVETYFEFIRAVFLIHLTLYFSPVPQDRSLSKYLEQISIELYRHFCSHRSRRQLVSSLDHTQNSVSFMNATLGILGLPYLQGYDGDSVILNISSDKQSSYSERNEDRKQKEVTELKPDGAATVPSSRPFADVNEGPSTFPGAVLKSNARERQAHDRKYVGLPVSASTFSSSSEYDSSSGSSKKESSSDSELVNLSVASVGATVEKLEKLNLSSSSSGDVFTSDIKSISSSSKGSSSESKPSSSDSSSFVDLSATTEDSWCRLSDELGELSPLVDLSCSTVNSSFESLSFGQSVKTDSPIEYLEHWAPPQVEESVKIHKALLLTYHPVTGDWISQSTLVHKGQELDLGSNRKGNCRDVFEVFFLHQDEPLGRYVCKRYRQQRPPRYYQQDVVCQMMAGHYVTMFNQRLQNCDSKIQVQFLPAAHLQLLTPGGELEDWVNIEPYLHGDFIKLTNNLAFSKKDHQGEELATTFTHFSYCESQGVLMIVDIQGWYPREGSGIIYLTDPQFHTHGVRKFSPADRQEEGMALFWSKVHPTCNKICASLNLKRPDGK